jgi:hypothetical protein
VYSTCCSRGQKLLDLRQLPGAEQAYRIGAETLTSIENPAVRTLATEAVAQVNSVDIKAQTPAIDIDLHQASLRLFIKTL